MKYISYMYITLSIHTLFGAAYNQTKGEIAENELNSKLIAFTSEELKQAHKQGNDSEIQAAAKELARLFLCESSRRQLAADKMGFVGHEIANNELSDEFGKLVSNEILKPWNDRCIALTNQREFSFDKPKVTNQDEPLSWPSVDVLRYNREGTRLAIGDSAGTIHELTVRRVWDLDTHHQPQACPTSVLKHERLLTGLCYDSDDGLTSVGEGGIIKRWDREQKKAHMLDHGDTVLGACYTPKDNLVSVSSKAFKVWDVRQSDIIEEKNIDCDAVSFSNDGLHMILLNKGKAVIWNLEQIKEERACELDCIEIACLNNNGSEFAFITKEKKRHEGYSTGVHSLLTCCPPNKCTIYKELNGWHVNALHFNPNGSQLLWHTADKLHVAGLGSTSKEGDRESVITDDHGITVCAYSPSGGQIAQANREGQVIIRELANLASVNAIAQALELYDMLNSESSGGN